MIADLDETIKKLLISELPIANGEVGIHFDQPSRDWSSKARKPALNFFLYDLRENVTLRQHQWQQSGKGNGRTDISRRKRSPYRVDCLYVITAWTTEPADEHRLLTRCLLALFRNPTLPEAYLVGEMQDQPFEVQARVASHDKFTNPAELWSALDNELRPSVSYIVTIALDPWREVTGPLVRSVVMSMGQSEEPPQQQFAEATAVTEVATIGGQVTRRGKPQADLQVAIKGTGLFAETDSNGRYRLAPLTLGQHTLVVWSTTGKPKEFKIEVPNGSYDVKL